jgi:hypothetical protein
MELFLQWETFPTKVVEKIKTHILSSVTVFQKLCHLWEVEKCGRVREATNHNVIWPMRFARWTTKATDKHSEYEILTALPWQQWLCEHHLFCLYIHCLPCSLYLAFNMHKNGSHRFTVVWNNVSWVPCTLSVKLSDFTVWCHTWWNTWVNCSFDRQ